ILPCVFIAFAMGMTTIKPSLAPDPILPLDPAIYGSEATSFFAISHATTTDGVSAATVDDKSNSDSDAISSSSSSTIDRRHDYSAAHHQLQWLEHELTQADAHHVPDCGVPRA